MHLRDYVRTDRAAVEAHLVEFQNHERSREPHYEPGADIAGPYLDGLLHAIAYVPGRLVVAVEAGAVIGYTCYLIRPVPHAVLDLFEVGVRQVEVTDLYVTPARRGRGVGRAMLAEIERYAVANRAVRTVLTTLARNVEGRAMYARCGFREFEVTLVRETTS